MVKFSWYHVKYTTYIFQILKRASSKYKYYFSVELKILNVIIHIFVNTLHEIYEVNNSFKFQIRIKYSFTLLTDKSRVYFKIEV